MDATKEGENNIFAYLDKTLYGFSAFGAPQEQLKAIIIPDQIRDEIPTLNKFGYMKIDLDEFTEEFVQKAAVNNSYNLELGTAYGYVVTQVLKRGGKIIANDVSREHLEVLLRNTDEEHLKNLFLYPGRFPNEIDLPDNSVASVLTSRMMHFLDAEEIDKGFKRIHDWLIPEGKLYFISVTPHHASFKDKFLPIYKEREKQGEKWPGRIENHWEISPQHEPYVPEFLHVFDVPQLEQLLPEYGFEIEKIGLFDYPKDTDSAGKGHIGLIARKV